MEQHELLSVIATLGCASVAIIGAALAGFAGARARSARTADMRKAWMLVAILILASVFGLALGCLGVLGQRAVPAFSGVAIFSFALLAMVNDRLRSFLVRATRDEGDARQ
ncbi:hypothetical protein BJG93_36555 (plasmid) [Paraburkholderia sprentiae WSM5005]|uniref:Uncharacterized protein n=1 Tax=Paraburkholderia sprentiae WSM5005 TaxID=754502 RepID=A0A8F4KHS2_9BURK|nr:hypothetical protein [Paraburkholderia sprentiae]QXE07359.1 hypothetical protein BJG93_36555 [Paraburkholderia sprentiae WSM5005]